MSNERNIIKSHVNSKLYKREIINGKEVLTELPKIEEEFLDTTDVGTYIPRYNIENTRLLRENSQATDEVSELEEKDYTREDQVEFPARTQIRNWVRQEFMNRTRNFGMQYTDSGESSDYDTQTLDYMRVYDSIDDLSEHDKKLYKGPKSAWVRVCSNAIVADANDPDKIYKGFILTGNGNFHDTYGFNKGDGQNGGGGEAVTLLGYDLDGKRHEIKNQDINTNHPKSCINETEDNRRNFRRTTISFTCWSPSQLDYLDAYFMKAGIVFN